MTTHKRKRDGSQSGRKRKHANRGKKRPNVDYNNDVDIDSDDISFVENVHRKSALRRFVGEGEDRALLDLEERYEKRIRASKDKNTATKNESDDDGGDNNDDVEKRVVRRLPVRREDGQWMEGHERTVKFRKTKKPRNDIDGDDSGDDDDEDVQVLQESDLDDEQLHSAEEEEAHPALSNTRNRQNRIKQIQHKIADICTEMLAEPPEHITKFKTLIEYFYDPDVMVKKMALLSSLALFKDLIPDYRIDTESIEQSMSKQRSGNDAGKPLRLSRAVSNRRFFEINLVKYYQQFLQFVEKNGRDSRSKLQFISVKCQSELLVRACHFNYSKTLVKNVVHALHSGREHISNSAFDGICQLFTEDPTHGEMSLEVVEEICELVQKRNYNVPTRAIDVFLALPLKTVLTDKELPMSFTKGATTKRRRQGKGKKKARDLTDREMLQRDLQMSQAEVSASEKKKIQIDILRNVVLCFVRLLKQKADSPLVFCALAGLSKFAHLMNLELLYDLLSYIKDILAEMSSVEEDMDEDDPKLDMETLMKKHRQRIPHRTVLQCLITSSKLMSGLGAALNIDPKEFYNQLYEAIPTTLCTYDEINTRLLIDALYLMLLKTNVKLSSLRVGAFVKRLLLFCFHAHNHHCIAILRLVQDILLKYADVYDQLFSDEESGFGQYNPDAANPDSANSTATSLWELYMLNEHYHAHTRELLSKFPVLVTDQSIKQRKALQPNDLQQLLTIYDVSSGTFVPPINYSQRVVDHLNKENGQIKGVDIHGKKVKKRKIRLANQPIALQASPFVKHLQKTVTEKQREVFQRHPSLTRIVE